MTTLTPIRATSTRSSHDHQCAQGFCTVCGSTWPCWRAQADDNPAVATAQTLARSLVLPRC
jgi:hypothetical protein